jgi:hypothetical protein
LFITHFQLAEFISIVTTFFDFRRRSTVDFDIASDIYIARNITNNIDCHEARDITLPCDIDIFIDIVLVRSLEIVPGIAASLSIGRNIANSLALAHDIDIYLALLIEFTDLQKSLQKLKDRLPDLSSENHNNFERWWKENSRDWTEELRAIMIEHRNIGHDWQFSQSQKKLLEQYYDANKLLVDCLNSDCYVSREVRAEIEASLLLPIKSLS